MDNKIQEKVWQGQLYKDRFVKKSIGCDILDFTNIKFLHNIKCVTTSSKIKALRLLLN